MTAGLLAKYRADQTRDDAGRFADEGVGSNAGARPSGPVRGIEQLRNIATRQPALFDDEHAYHVTSEERLDDIVTDGHLQTHRPYEYTDQDAWPDGSRARRSYFAAREGVDHVWQFAPEHGGQAVLLRTRRKRLFGAKARATFTRRLQSRRLPSMC